TGPTELTGGAARDPEEEADQQDRGAEAQQQRLPPRPRLVQRMRIDGHALRLEQRLQTRISELRHHRLEQVRVGRVRLIGRIGDRLLERALNDVGAAGYV